MPTTNALLDLGYKQAQSILGRNFISPEEITASVGIQYSDADLDVLARHFPPYSLLENGDFLLPAPPGAKDFSQIIQDVFGRVSYQQKILVDNRPEKTCFRWLLFRDKSSFFATRGLAETEQVKYLDSKEQCPRATSLAWLLGICSKVKGVKIIKDDECLRTSSKGVHKEPVTIGFPGEVPVVYLGHKVEEGYENLGMIPMVVF